MIVNVGQAAPKSTDVKSTKTDTADVQKDEFSNLLSQEINQTQPKVVQSTEQKKKEDSGIAKDDSGEQLDNLAQTQGAEAFLNTQTPVDETTVLSAQGVISAAVADSKVASTTEITDVKVSVKPLLEGEMQTGVMQGAQSEMPIEGSIQQAQGVLLENSTQTGVMQGSQPEMPTQGSEQQAQDVLLEDITQTVNQPIETQQNNVFVEQLAAQSLKQNAGGQPQETKPDLVQPEQLEKSEKIQVSALQGNLNDKAKSGTTKEEQLPMDNAVEAKIETKQLDFAQAVKDSSFVGTPNQKVVVEQVLKQINSTFDSQTSEFSFNLYPKDLGKVGIKMLMEDGMLIVEIAASNAKTQSILAANVNEIKEILQSQSAQKQFSFVDASQNSQPHDYVRDESSNHDGKNQSSSQDQQNQNEDESDQNFTADFLSVMQMVNSIRIQDRW
ncbi:MAG: flagellar hook-length control protein FliK [Clostridia bacterium]|nr:flagellar hook-length control protein FliK [Clostridia bacterium]